MKKNLLVTLLLVLTLFNVNIAQTKGKLVIVGGEQTIEIVKKYVELAGGSDAKIIVIPNAGSEPVKWSNVQVDEFNELGAKADYLLFTRETADDEVNYKEDGLGKCSFLFRRRSK